MMGYWSGGMSLSSTTEMIGHIAVWLLWLMLSIIGMVALLLASIGVYYGCKIGKTHRKVVAMTRKIQKRLGKANFYFDAKEDRFVSSIMFANEIQTGWESLCIPKDVVDQLHRHIILPVISKDVILTLPHPVKPPKGVLFTGPSGTGKSLLARVLAKETQCSMLYIHPCDLHLELFDTSIGVVEALFSLAKKLSPCIIFIDQIDSLFDKNAGNQLTAAFTARWGRKNSDNEEDKDIVIVMGATNRHKEIEPNFLRRFDLNIEIPLPSYLDRVIILEIHLKGLALERGFSLRKLAALTNGFTGADLQEVVRYAIVNLSTEKLQEQHEKNEAEKENNNKVVSFKPSSTAKFETTENVSEEEIVVYEDVEEPLPEKPKSSITITMEEMVKSIKHSKKSRSKGGGGIGGLDQYEIAIAGLLIQADELNVTWKNIAGLNDIIRDIKSQVILPIMAVKKTLTSNLVSCPKGILFHGPPGTGKTMLAKAMAYHSKCAFINLDSSILYNKYYGESGKLASALFRVAEKYQPTIIFIDEIDGFLRTRESEDSELTASLKAQFLSLWDGILTNPDKVIIVMGASNRPEKIDPAVMRRLTRKYNIPLPDIESREQVFKLILDNENIADDVNTKILAVLTDGFSPSEIKDVISVAALDSLKMINPDDILSSPKSLQSMHLLALDNCRSVEGAWASWNGSLENLANSASIRFNFALKEINMSSFVNAIEDAKISKLSLDVTAVGCSMYS